MLRQIGAGKFHSIYRTIYLLAISKTIGYGLDVVRLYYRRDYELSNKEIAKLEESIVPCVINVRPTESRR
jgi:hypothetical protein